MSNASPILAQVRRGQIVEAYHRGVIVMAEPDGRILSRLGDDRLITSTRSTIKPIQAIPLIVSGAADRFDFGPREIAVACASHEGEAIHTDTVRGMLARIGLDEGAMLCGAQPPYNQETARQLESEGRPFTQLHNNCSGKHAGMLATAVHMGATVEDYVSPAHPVQREIISTLAALGDLDPDLTSAVDGCSAPTFGVPLGSLAVAFARMANPEAATSLAPRLREACRRIVRAMIAHPEMVGGTRRFDTDLLRAARGKLICKVGAEAVYSVGVLPCDEFPRGLGIAFKMEDGSYRGLGPAVVEALGQLGVLGPQEMSELAAYHNPAIENRRGLKVGEVRATFDLRSEV